MLIQPISRTHTRLSPVTLTAVQLTDDFWLPRMRANQVVTLTQQYQQLERTGRLANFMRAGGQGQAEYQGYFFNDSDVYKWLEAAAWSLAVNPDEGLTKLVDTVITLIAAAQQPDGYLNTYFMFEKAGERWTNLRDMHELYCAGHLIQAAIALYRSTGGDRLLNVARAAAGHIDQVFGSEGKPGTPGHPEIEMALVELYRTTGEARFLRLAQSFIDQRGYGLIGGGEHHMDHLPFRSLEQLAGHAVRALYLCCGAADVYIETGEQALRQTLERLWTRLVASQLYVSGGAGARYEGEAFGRDYELPNSRAYAETCAAIASVMLNWRMLQLDGQARYADLLEWTLFNAVLPGISLDGTAFFYVNPLASNGLTRRQPWFECACCPTNIVRLLATLPAYFYGQSEEGIWVHQYASGQANFILTDATPVQIRQTTRYPWSGEIELAVDGEGPFSVFVRIPGWVEGLGEVRLNINGEAYTGSRLAASYVEIRRTWHSGDRIQLSLPLATRLLTSHPHVLENTGRAALVRGPLLYCVEGIDHPGLDLRDLEISPTDLGQAVYDPELLYDVTVIRMGAKVVRPERLARLYRPFRLRTASQRSPITLTCVPYYSWANRQTGPMQVWLKIQGD